MPRSRKLPETAQTGHQSVCDRSGVHPFGRRKQSLVLADTHRESKIPIGHHAEPERPICDFPFLDFGILRAWNTNEVYCLTEATLLDGAFSLERLEARLIQMIVEVRAYPTAFRSLADDWLV